MQIITNHHPRDVIDAWQLTADERAEFDYLDWPAIEDGRDSASFVRYKGELIDLADIDGIPPTGAGLEGWDGYKSDSFFSGLVFRYPREDCYGRPLADSLDTERVIVGRYFS
jgi:hypothetical protein